MSKNYLITGACRGIGRGLTRHLLQKGHRVFLFDNNEVEIEHMKTQLPKWSPSSSTATSSSPSTTNEPQWRLFQGDISQRADILLAADSAAVFFDGSLDVLINNAAVTEGVIHETPISSDAFPDLWDTSLAVNLTGSMLMSRACLPLLRRNETRKNGGSIIFMSSTRARQSEPHSEAYAATKAGLLGLSQALSCSLAKDNVKVNAILPGWINVAHESKDGDKKGMRWEAGLSKEDNDWHFSGRVGKLDDVAKAVEWLSDDDGFVTGQEVVLDGGVTRKMVYPE
jgi:NAD(P)-dependent dehydrogenase (short-subunit alcohol dehydrogenase family)